MIREYTAREYCGAIECPHYCGGHFDDICSCCPAFNYYQWLQKNNFHILKMKGQIFQEVLEENTALWECLSKI